MPPSDEGAVKATLTLASPTKAAPIVGVAGTVEPLTVITGVLDVLVAPPPPQAAAMYAQSKDKLMQERRFMCDPKIELTSQLQCVLVSGKA